MERGDVAAARLELRHLDVLSQRVMQDELFIRAARERDLQPEDLVGCLSEYLAAITDSMPFEAPAGDDDNGDGMGEDAGDRDDADEEPEPSARDA